MTMVDDELKKYIPIADAVARTFGKGCEVVLHDLTSPQSSVVYTANGHVTGRSIGQSFNHLITQVLLSKNLRDDVVANYPTQTVDNRAIKSSTALIRNSRQEVIGAFCINFDLQKLLDFKGFLDDFTELDSHSSGIEHESEGVEVVGTVLEVVDNIIERTISEDVDEMDKNKKIQLVQFMDEKGVFLVKGALEKVAASLKISKPTIYSYLDEIRNHREEKYKNAMESTN